VSGSSCLHFDVNVIYPVRILKYHTSYESFMRRWLCCCSGHESRFVDVNSDVTWRRWRQACNHCACAVVCAGKTVSDHWREGSFGVVISPWVIRTHLPVTVPSCFSLIVCYSVCEQYLTAIK